ncbi:MAG: GAF domain-containing protein [Bacteroidota bacterium]
MDQEAKREEAYRLLIRQLEAFLEAEPDPIANLANASALLNESLEDLNWVGFYLLQGETLVLGPFQGKVACTRIPVGKGVCGTAVRENRALLVPDVERFPGHIACDCASRSELVLLLKKEETIFGVLDLDSPKVDRFDALDERFLAKFAAVIAAHWQRDPGK